MKTVTERANELADEIANSIKESFLKNYDEISRIAVENKNKAGVPEIAVSCGIKVQFGKTKTWASTNFSFNEKHVEKDEIEIEFNQESLPGI